MAVSPTPAEMAESRQWAAQHVETPSDVGNAPFSFEYGGRPSSEFLKSCRRKVSSHKLDDRRTRQVAVYTDPKTGLEVTCESVVYADFPALEWVVYFKNCGTVNTPILKDIQALDIAFQRGNEGDFTLHGIRGDSCTADSYEPYRVTLAANAVKQFSPPASGKSCDGPDGWPYYNLQVPGGGILLAVGWPGQWASSFTRDASTGLRIKAGQQQTRLYLKPGEKIRTPLIAMLFWRGVDVVRAQNLWRRWYLAHNIPRVHGRPQPPLAQIQVGGGKDDINYVETFLQAGVRPDICWRDAGGGNTWYPSSVGPYKGPDIWLNTGTWEIDSTKYPAGFKPFTDWIHARGMQFVLWFEPERVGSPDSWLGKQHPQWLLPGTSHGSLLDEGNPAALNWLINHVDGMIKSQGIDWYREDMNGCGPLPAWRKNDAENRQGITENHYVQGHLAFWDELKRRNPGLQIDSCASGGRRNDLETMRRAVPLLRSDFQFPDMKGVVEGNQGHTYGLSSWLPFQGTGVYSYDAYSVRSFYLPSFGMGTLTAENAKAQKKAYDECRKIAPLMLLGDYYPLTPYSLSSNAWIAWQFHCPEKGEGVVQAFRRAECPSTAIRVRLGGLDPDAVYTMTDFDAPGDKEMTGRELLEGGLPIVLNNRPAAAIITYRTR